MTPPGHDPAAAPQGAGAREARGVVGRGVEGGGGGGDGDGAGLHLVGQGVDLLEDVLVVHGELVRGVHLVILEGRGAGGGGMERRKR